MRLYRDVLRSAWQHTIHRPGLWVFGFFATLVFGASGELDRYLRFMNAIVTDGHSLNVQSWLDGEWVVIAGQLYAGLLAGRLNLYALLIVGILSLALVVWLISISVGALIHSAKHSTEKFTDAFQAGMKHWEQLTVLFVSAYVIVTVASLALVSAVVTAMAGASFENIQLAVVLVAAVVFVPVVVVLSLLVRLTALSVVLDNTHLLAAVRQSWKLFKQHWLVILEMAIVSFVVVTTLSLVVLIGLITIFLPYFVSLTAGGALVTYLRFQNTMLFGQWLYLAVSLFSAALFSTWQWSAWTLLFETLRTGKPESSLARWIGSVK